MQGWTWRAVILGALVTVLIYTATRPDPDTAGLSQATPAELVELLQSSRDVVRRGAAARLLSHGSSAVPALLAAVPAADDYELDQILLVLEDLYVSADETIADAAEEAIEQLAASEQRPIRQAADQIFQSNMARRHLRACAKVEAFGGRFLASPMAMSGGSDVQFPFDIAVIGPDWTGGEQGLKFLRRIRGLSYIHVATDAALSDRALQMLKPALTVRREHEACLGLELKERPDTGLTIRRLVEHSPATKADLQRDDQILEMDGTPIHAYWDYITRLHALPPGAELELKIRRNGKFLTVRVTLGSDFATGYCHCEGEEFSPEPTPAGEDVALNDEAAARPAGAGNRPLPTTDRISPPPQDMIRARHRPHGDVPAFSR